MAELSFEAFYNVFIGSLAWEETLTSDYLNESYWTVFPSGSVYCA